MTNNYKLITLKPFINKIFCVNQASIEILIHFVHIQRPDGMSFHIMNN